MQIGIEIIKRLPMFNKNIRITIFILLLLLNTTLKYDALDTLVFCYSLTGARFSVSSKSSFTGTTIRAASVFTIGIDVTHGDRSAAFIHICNEMQNRA